MNNDPLGLALQEITETKTLLERLITSSESFDYLQAHVALKTLNRKMRQLGRLQSKMRAEIAATSPNIYLLDFQKGTAEAQP
jgi:hypothetical protein